MKRHYLLMLLVGLPLAVLAGPRTRSQAQAIALQQAKALGINTTQAKMKAAPRAATSESTTEPYYIFNNGGGQGFTVVSGDDQLPDIVGYATTGTYDAATAPPQLAAYLLAYEELSEAVANGDRQALALAAEAKALRASSSYKPVAVSPLLEKEGIHYNQDAPYNNLCPEYTTGKTSATGCVATAMAQVMRYYKFPTSLQATIPSYTTATHGITIPEIAAGQTYDWNNMLPDYESTTYTDAQATAVATLMKHCGAAVRMDYDDSSGANITPILLYTYFGYDSDLIEMVDRTVCTQQQWNQILDTELQAGRPVLYEGFSSSGGHEFVCDGADGQGLYHINWGWGGYENGFFDITTLNPKKGGIGSGSAPDGYNRMNGIIIGIAPDNGKKDEMLYVQPVTAVVSGSQTGLAWTTTERTDATQTFKGQAKYWFTNTNTTAFDGYIGLAIVQSDGTYNVIVSNTAQIPAVQRDLSYNSEQASFATMTFDIDYAFPVGSHELQTVYSTDGTSWQPCINYNFAPTTIDVTATELTDATESPLEAEATLDGDVYTDCASTLTLTVTNTGTAEYNGTLNLYAKLNDDTTPTTDDLYDQVMVYVGAGETVTRTVTIGCADAGTLYFWLSDPKYDGEIIFQGSAIVHTNGTPELSLVSLTTNATEGEYESTNAYYAGYQVRMPIVKDDKAVFTARIQNTGEDYKGTLTFALWNPVANPFTYIGRRDVTAVFDAGETTELSIEVTPEEAGTRSIYCSIGFADKTPTLTVPSDNWYLYTTSGGYFTETQDERVVYVAGSPTGIERIETALTTADAPIYTLDGVRIERISRPGIYIQGGRKVVVGRRN